MRIEMDTLINRFKDYVSYDTKSADENDTVCPSTPGQLVLAQHIAGELKALGLADVTLDEHGYVMATLPANGCEGAPVVGFISHMDTAPDASGANIKPQIVNYEGGDIVLNEELDIKLSPKDYPGLLKYKGQPIMTTDGTTLLGADDKAGVTAIVSAAEYLLAHPELKHGKIRLGFTPDEEVGRSANLFDVEKFAADFAYTVDGDELGGLEYENFNAVNATITFHGRSSHTGDAKGKMLNANTLACEWQEMLPKGERPELTTGYEGFYHVHQMSGNVEKLTMKMLIRDFDKESFADRVAYLDQMAAFMNKKYGAGTVTVDAKVRYLNMREKIEPVMEIIELARKAMEEAGVTPVVKPIRGGTDGARLSFKGLPCPNLFTGGTNFHGRFEYLPLLSLQKASETVLGIMLAAGELKK